ncbi:INACTIVE [Ceraceosorus bombacis]|uniref:INACTIVE n=1 Tax=Ceraceosorus bombacis TaxID=401625 RepID=A0A0P1BTD2_9BASI|nr:INACTIVE [Ceraceosorus bombacis]
MSNAASLDTESAPLLAQSDASQPNIEAGHLSPTTALHPTTILALTIRLQKLLNDFITFELSEDRITDNEGIIEPAVVDTFLRASGDLPEAVPFALLRARRNFNRDASSHRSPELSALRALASEVLATRVVARLESDYHAKRDRAAQQAATQAGVQGQPAIPLDEPAAGPYASEQSHLCISKRFVTLEDDGDETLPTSALEEAADQNCVIFLASAPASHCAEALWAGHLVQSYAQDGSVHFVPYHSVESGSFLTHLDPSRLAVPRNAYYTSISMHMVLLFLYTMTTLEYNGFDFWEGAFWIFAASYVLEDLVRWIKIRGIDNLSFWLIVDLLTDVVFITSFFLRVSGWVNHGDHRSELQLSGFRLLACAAPLLWMSLLKWGDGLRYLGVIQIVLLRMLRETAAFFVLLGLTAIGFAQCLFALDAADGRRVDNSISLVANILARAPLGDASWDTFDSEQFGQPYGLIMFYLYVFTQVLLLTNILIAFFGQAYGDVVETADDLFAAYFAQKVVGTIRAPDQYVYLPPFNLVEAFLIAPLEHVLSSKSYAALNRAVQSTIYAPALLVIALYESRFDSKQMRRIKLEMLDRVPGLHLGEREGMGRVKGTAEDPEISDWDRSAASTSREGVERVPIVLARTAYKDLLGKLPKIRKEDNDEGQEEETKEQRADSSSGAKELPDDALKLILAELQALRKEVEELKRSTANGSSGAEQVKQED